MTQFSASPGLAWLLKRTVPTRRVPCAISGSWLLLYGVRSRNGAGEAFGTVRAFPDTTKALRTSNKTRNMYEYDTIWKNIDIFLEGLTPPPLRAGQGTVLGPAVFIGP